MLTILLFVFVSLIIGGILGWLVSRGKAAAQLVVLNASLSAEQQSHERTKKDYNGAADKRDEYLGAKSKAESDCAGWKKGYDEQVATLKLCKEEHIASVQILKDERDHERTTKDALAKEVATLRESDKQVQARIAEQQKFIEDAEQKLKDAFSALSTNALKTNNESFIELANAKLDKQISEAKGELDKKEHAITKLVQPLSESLGKMDEKINQLEQKREGAYGNIATLLDQMKQSTAALDLGTRNLVGALKTSHTRGRWGEIALRRLVEFAGMSVYCDFTEQESTETDNGRLRPDMIVNMPEGRRLPVDSKVPFDAYYSMHETEDTGIQKTCLSRHVEAVRKHIKDLSAKVYWDQFAEAPDFVVLYMHIESSFGAALQACPTLIEEALAARVVIATPTTLISMLRSVAYSWQQRSTMANIDAIRDAAVELYERSCVLMDHLKSLGKTLNTSVNHYNRAVGSLEGSFLPQGRRITALAAGYVRTREEAIPLATPIETSPREITAQYPQPQIGNVPTTADEAPQYQTTTEE